MITPVPPVRPDDAEIWGSSLKEPSTTSYLSSSHQRHSRRFSHFNRLVRLCYLCSTVASPINTGLFFVHFAKNSRPKKLKILAFGQKLKGFFAKNSRLWGPILKMTKKLKNHKTEGYKAQSKQSQKNSKSKQSTNLNASLWLGLLDPC